MAVQDDSHVRVPRYAMCTGPLPGGIYFPYVCLCPHLSPILVSTHQPSEIHAAALLCLSRNKFLLRPSLDIWLYCNEAIDVMKHSDCGGA